MANCPLCGHEIPDRKCTRCGKAISQNQRQLYCPECAKEMQRLQRLAYWRSKGSALRKARNRSK